MPILAECDCPLCGCEIEIPDPEFKTREVMYCDDCDAALVLIAEEIEGVDYFYLQEWNHGN